MDKTIITINILQILIQTGDKLITEHPSHNKVQKYLKFADQAKGNKSKFLNELFY